MHGPPKAGVDRRPADDNNRPPAAAQRYDRRMSRRARHSGHARTRQNGADDNLAAENYSEINRAYYTAEPADYFEERLNNLLLAAGNPDGRAELLRKGGAFGEVKFGEATGRPSDDKEAPQSKAVERFVQAETEVLAHHVGETLLRLYLAHEPLPACPALGLARVRSPATFKAMVRSRFLDGPHDDRAYRPAVSTVFHLVADPSHVRPDPGAEKWWASVDNIEHFLRHFASVFVEQASLYNSAKHGMALTPTEFGFQLGDSELTREHGPAIYYLEQRADSKSEKRRWFSTFHWVRTDRQTAMTFMGIELIRTLWKNARLRYTEKHVTGAEFHFFDKPRFDQVMTAANERGVEWTSMSIELVYWKEIGEEDEGTNAS